MKVFSQLEKAQLEVLTSDPTGTGLVVGRIWYRSDIKLYKVYDGAAVQTFVDLNTAQTLASKILATPQIDDAAIFEEITTPAAPSAGYRKIYPKTDGWYEQNSSGTESPLGSGGAGGKNYFSTAVNLGTSVSGFSQYADTAGAKPVDGTGGSPSGNFSIASSASSPLSGTSSLVISKDSNNRQGEGLSYDITLDTSDKGKVLALSFNYAVASGTYADDDVIFYAYDATNNVLLESVPFKIKNHTLGSDKFFAELQTPYNCSTLRLIFHCSSTSALAYSLKVDDLLFGPQAKLYGSVVTDWVDYTPTGSWTTNTTYTGKYRRVGSDAEFQVKVAMSGTPSAGSLTVNLPSGITFNSSSMVQLDSFTSTDYNSSGKQGSGGYKFYSVYNNASSVLVVYQSTTGAVGAAVTPTAPVSFVSGDYIIVRFKGPITGWSSSQVMSHDADTRVVAFIAADSQPSGTIATTFASSSSVIFDSALHDTHGAYNTTNGEYEAKVSGFYQLSGILSVSGTMALNNLIALAPYVDGVIFPRAKAYVTIQGGASEVTIPYNLLVYANAGQKITMRAASNITSPAFVASSDGNTLTITKLSGPSQIAASEKIYVQYKTGAGQSLTSAGVINFGTKVEDSHGAVTTGASWKFTAPRNDVYYIDGFLFSANLTDVSSIGFNCLLRKNAIGDKVFRGNSTGISNQATCKFSFQIRLLAGEYIDIYNNDAHASGSLYADANENVITISTK